MANNNSKNLTEDEKNAMIIGGAAALGAASKVIEAVLRQKPLNEVVQDAIIGGVTGGVVGGAGKLALDQIIKSEEEKRKSGNI